MLNFANVFKLEVIMEHEELSMDNILGTEEIDNLFTDVSETESQEETNTEEQKENTTETIDSDDLFEQSESVGSGTEDNKGTEDTESTQGSKTSPKNNFYSSIAKALKEDGVFPDLDEETANSIKEAEDFAQVIEQHIQAKFDERQKRIDDALNAGIEVSEIKKYENTIQYLDSIKDDNISDEGEAGENLRKQLIYQDFVNRGYSKERALREVQKSFNAGSDIEDAKEALQSNKQFFEGLYDKMVKDAKAEEEREEKERKEQDAKLKKSILEDNKVFGDLQLDKATRQKVIDNISKPIYKNPETGELLTAIQKYERENRTDFLKNVGILYTLTDGFKNLDSLVKGKVNKEMKKGLRELENTLNNTARTSDGNLNFMSGVGDSESIISKGWKLDI